MKKLLLMTAVASFGFVNGLKAEEAAIEATVEQTPVIQVESAVVVETLVVEEKATIIETEAEVEANAVVETPQEIKQPVAMGDKPIIALFYADWCGSCKILEPRMEAAMAQLADKDAMKIVKFDLTDDATKEKSAAMAEENGLTDLYNDNAPKTGFAILVDGNAVEPVTLTKKDSIAEIKAKLEAFAAASQS